MFENTQGNKESIQKFESVVMEKVDMLSDANDDTHSSNVPSNRLFSTALKVFYVKWNICFHSSLG